MLDRVSDPRLSPDGRFLVYDVRATDWTANKGVHALWLFDSRTPAMPPRKLAISDKGATSPRWSADAKRIYFLSSRAGSQQVWRTDADGLDAVQVTNLPVDVAAFRPSPDGKTLVIAAEVFPDCADFACTKARIDARKAGGVSGATYDRLPFVVWDNWMAGTQAHLYALTLDASGAASAAPVALMKGFDADSPTRPFGDDGDFAFVDGGRGLVFAALAPGDAWGVSEETHLYQALIDGSAAPKMISPRRPAPTHPRPPLRTGPGSPTSARRAAAVKTSAPASSCST